MERFRMDNTAGCTQDQIDELNRRYRAILASLPNDEAECKSITDRIAEQVLTEFDTE